MPCCPVFPYCSMATGFSSLEIVISIAALLQRQHSDALITGGQRVTTAAAKRLLGRQRWGGLRFAKLELCIATHFCDSQRASVACQR